jgi:hypothetical protein
MRGANGNNATHSVSTHVSFTYPFRLRLVTGLKKWAQTPKVYVFNTDTGKVVTVLRCVAVHSDIRFDANGLALPEAK